MGGGDLGLFGAGGGCSAKKGAFHRDADLVFSSPRWQQNQRNAHWKPPVLFKARRASSCMCWNEIFPGGKTLTPRTRWKDTRSGRGGLCCRGARRSGRWVPPARGEWKPSRGVYTKPRSASPVERRNNSTRPGWKCGKMLWRDPNRVVHKTAGMARQPLLPLSDCFHLCFPREGAAVDCTEDITEHKDGHAR